MRQHHVEIYRDRKKEWRWRAKASNGKVLADSAEGFKRRRRCVQNVRLTVLALIEGGTTLGIWAPAPRLPGVSR
jgi:uncharacterized protein YegP (UPF0339 family)